MKNTDIENYILDLIEKEYAFAGAKLPGALKLAALIGCAPPRVQNALENLTVCGILETRHRSGTYVRSNWEQQILPRHLSFYGRQWSFADELDRHLKIALPDLRFSRKFRRGGIELAVTHRVLSHQDEYVDLTSIFNDLFPDRSLFFRNALDSFFINGRLCGIPFVFSPELFFYNPELLACAGVAEPEPDWTFDDLARIIRNLSEKFPGQVMDPGPKLDDWINFVIRSGGKLLDPRLPDPVCLDTPETIRGLQRYASLFRLLRQGNPAPHTETYLEFAEGKTALLFGFRQTLRCIREHNPSLPVKCLPLPRMNGCRANVQGAELLVFRKGCADERLIREVLKYFLSEETQIFWGKKQGGIPFLRSAAEKVINTDDPIDRLFMAEIPNVSTEYNIYTENLFHLITRGIHRIFSLPPEKFEYELRRLAEAVRTVYDIENFVQ